MGNATKFHEHGIAGTVIRRDGRFLYRITVPTDRGKPRRITSLELFDSVDEALAAGVQRAGKIAKEIAEANAASSALSERRGA